MKIVRPNPIYVLGLLVASCAAMAAYTLSRLEQARLDLARDSLRAEGRIETLDERIRFQTERSRVVRAFRKEMRRLRPEAEAARADDYARYALLATDTYPSVDPLLLLAMGTVESTQDEKAVSHAGARGLYQILPSTGRRLAREMGWNFDEDILDDPHLNTLMATRYLEELITDHGDDLRVALAAYNGGPRNAARFKADSSRLAEETRRYVPKVIGHYERLVESSMTPVQEVSLASDRNRAMDEALPEASTSPPIGIHAESSGKESMQQER
jgi:soluble lytic murein transglycosylase-like protein